MSQGTTITAAELHRRHEAGERVRLVDVRTPAEFRAEHVPFAVNVPLDRFDAAAAKAVEGEGPLYVICRSGSRARMACDRVRPADGVTPVVVEGGTEAWVNAGYGVTRGKGVMSLERQVRIAAGSLVLLGVILSVAAHPGFIALSGFVGAGLIFAGVTDSCAMGMLLARMPWNQVKPESGAPACSR